MDQQLPIGSTENSGQLRQGAAKCVMCGLCRAVCPSFLIDSRESDSPRGRIAMIRGVLTDRLAPSRTYRDRLDTCVSCLACEAVCPSKVPVASLIGAARESAFRMGGDLISAAAAAALGNPGLMGSLAWLAPVALHYGLPGRLPAGQASHAARIAPRKPAPASRGRAALYLGCAIRFFQNDIARASVMVLEACGYEVLVLDNADCCGRPLLSLGDRGRAAELARRNRAIFGSLDVDFIVTACASCGLTLKREYSDLPGGPASHPAILDIHEVLAASADRLAPRSRYEIVTWHEPCHLTRGQGLARAVETALGLLPGAEFREPEHPGRCCGFGGIMRIRHHAFSDAVGALKAKEIIRTDPHVVATGCPGCRMQIQNSLKRSGSAIEVVHTVQLIAARIEALPE